MVSSNFVNVFEQDGRHVKSIPTDGGGEYQKQMAKFCREAGIHHEVTAPYTPEQNGIAERANRTICERIRAILADTGLPKELWAELPRTVAHTWALKNDSLRGFIWRKARRLVPCCNWHKSICAHSQEENAKVGSPQFRRNYGRIWRIASISNLDPRDEQDQGIPGCALRGRSNKKYDSSWNSGSA